MCHYIRYKSFASMITSECDIDSLAEKMRNLHLTSLIVCAIFLNGIRCTETEENISDEDEVDQIVGGVVASKGQYPYMVFFKNSANQLFCTGTLITPNKVLTTAWCFPSFNSNSGISATMNTLTTFPDADRVIRRVLAVVKAPDYNPNTGLHNIAIATLDSFVPSTSVVPVTLGFGVPVYQGNQAVTVGWGYTEPTYITTYLRHSYITIQPNSLCSSSFANALYGGPYFLCAASPGVGSCSLDAGSPILLGGRQIGISSRSRCGGGEPVLAIDVRNYEKWIRTNAV